MEIVVGAVNDAPVAGDDSFSTSEDQPLTVAAPGTLGNDSDTDGDSLTAVLVNGPSNGTLSLSANGSFTYTPNAAFNGTDSFTYKANDGALDSNVATVEIVVAPVVLVGQPVVAPVQDRSAVVGKRGSGIEAGHHHRRRRRLDDQLAVLADRLPAR